MIFLFQLEKSTLWAGPQNKKLSWSGLTDLELTRVYYDIARSYIVCNFAQLEVRNRNIKIIRLYSASYYCDYSIYLSKVVFFLRFEKYFPTK